MTRIWAGESFVSVEDVDGADAAQSLVEQAMADGSLDNPEFGVLFCSPQFDVEAVVEHVQDRLSAFDTTVVGGTTAGEISQAGSTFGGATLLLVESDGVTFDTVVRENLHEDPVDTSAAAAEELLTDDFWESDDEKALMVLSGGFTADQADVGYEIMQGLGRVVTGDIPIVGGLTGDDMVLDANYQFVNGKVLEDGLILVSIASSYTLHTGKEHGLRNQLKTGVVSESEGKVIKTISGQPAAEFYADAIGVEVSDLKQPYETPAGVELQKIFDYGFQYTFGEEVGDEIRIMTPVSVTEDDGIAFAVKVQENKLVHIVEGHEEDIVLAAKDAFDNVDVEQEEPLFAIVFDCCCRNFAMDEEERETEVERLRNHLDCPVIGFYTYGEFGGKDKNFCTFQNQTLSGLLFTDERR